MRNRSARAGLTRRGWGFVVASLVALPIAYLSGLRELLYVGLFLGVLPLLAYLLVRLRRPRLSVSRTFAPHLVEAGSSTRVSLLLRNLSGRRSVRALWWDRLAWHPGRTEEAELRPLEGRGVRSLGRGSAVTLGYELHPPHRGVFAVGPVGIRTGDALGLAVGSLGLGEPQQLVVTPEVIPLADTGLSISSGEGQSRLVQRRSAGDDDDAMTREYRSGDAMRRVHWRATARHGDLMVRQEEQRSFPEARILLDTRADGYLDLRDGLGGRQDAAAQSNCFEWAVRMLASTAVHLAHRGFLVSIQESAPAQLDAGPRGRRWRDEDLLSGLAAVRLLDGAAIQSLEGADLHTQDGPEHRVAPGPIIALVASPAEQTVQWMLRQRRSGELGVVFMVQPLSDLELLGRAFGLGSDATSMSGSTAQRFTEAGWLVVAVREDDDHTAAWEAVVVETGRARVGG